MSKKLYEKALAGAAGLRFSELQRLTEAAGFVLKRIRGSHHVYTRQGVPEIIDLQPHGKAAKPYQVRQVLALVKKYAIVIE